MYYTWVHIIPVPVLRIYKKQNSWDIPENKLKPVRNCVILLVISLNPLKSHLIGQDQDQSEKRTCGHPVVLLVRSVSFLGSAIHIVKFPTNIGTVTGNVFSFSKCRLFHILKENCICSENNGQLSFPPRIRHHRSIGGARKPTRQICIFYL